MMKYFTKKRVVVGLVAVGVAAAGTMTALAFFTSTGSGSGSAAVGTAANNITVNASVNGTLYPGGPAATVTFVASNPSNFHQKISGITLPATGIEAYASGDTGFTGSTTGCDTSAFSMPAVAVGADGDLATSAAVTLTELGTLSMANKTVSQDNCALNNLKLTFTTS